jgi:hypothetical protein
LTPCVTIIAGGYGSLRAQGRRKSMPRSRATHGHGFEFQIAGRHRIHVRDLAAHCARVLAFTFRPLQSEGAGNAGRPMRPIAACAEIVGREHTRWSGHTGIARHSPRNGFTAYFVLFPAIGFFVTVTPEKLASHGLERQRRGVRTTRLRRPPQAPSSQAPSASTASCPASVTISSRPSVGQDSRGFKLIWSF